LLKQCCDSVKYLTVEMMMMMMIGRCWSQPSGWSHLTWRLTMVKVRLHHLSLSVFSCKTIWQSVHWCCWVGCDVWYSDWGGLCSLYQT